VSLSALMDYPAYLEITLGWRLRVVTVLGPWSVMFCPGHDTSM